MEEQRNQTRIRCTLDLQLDRCCLDGTPWFLQRLPTEFVCCMVRSEDWCGMLSFSDVCAILQFEAHLFYKSRIQV